MKNKPKIRAALFKMQKGLCHWCKRPMVLPKKDTYPYTPDMATIEHLIPKARGGTNDIENLAVACRQCNWGRGDRVVETKCNLSIGIPRERIHVTAL